MINKKEYKVEKMEGKKKHNKWVVKIMGLLNKQKMLYKTSDRHPVELKYDFNCLKNMFDDSLLICYSYYCY